ncbi:amidase [Aeromicrobium duanguangcaii]|uniref:amidase n=1 Tax=Aeromicrobium duanguangcaii TaxID=2968086 RepID=UPI002017342E|nr:amidase [Aeromicrobium duanguangcaii]MCL3836501.1 amidase [Aeromicrobium duanguangcaii]
MTDVLGDPAPDGLLEAFWDYETALMGDDLAALDRLFAEGPDTLRGDAAGLLVGHEQISRFRGGRGGAPARSVLEVHVRSFSHAHALVIAITELERGGRGQQTQVWRRGADGWRVMAAHVAVPAPAFDSRVWRVVGDPLVRPTGSGPLDGETVAVKDLFAVAGQPVGAGNPAWLEQAPVEPTPAWAVRMLTGGGAAVRGITRTDEFAYSLAGTNAHHGTPPNPRAPGRISGGSSSGSASAVSLGHASIGLGTDTGGSIRVPAAYQGLYGLRTTHGAVPTAGVMPLAPSFDTVGWLTRDAGLLARVGDVLLPDVAPRPVREVVVVPELLALAEPDVAAAVEAFADRESAPRESWSLAELESWREAFRVHQAAQAWASHGAWLRTRLDVLGPDVHGRFEAAAAVSPDEASVAAARVTAARQTIRELVGDRVIVLPSASSVAPLLGADPGQVRDATLRLTCLAGLGGLPALSIPTATAEGLPCGVSLVAAPGRDRDLLAFAVAHAERLRP